MRKIPPVPILAVCLFVAIVVAVRLASRHPSPIPFLRPDVLAAALFLYAPLLHYRRGRAPSWIRIGDVRKSAWTGLALAAAGALAFFVYARLPLPAPFLPYAGPTPTAFEFLFRQGLLAALPEEVFFRGYLHDAFEEKGWGPILPTSILFAAGHLFIHASPFRALTFFPGLLLGWARKTTGNVHVPAFLHLLFNLLPYVTAGGS